MIQRIQSVYLLLVTALLVSNIFLPVGSFLDKSGAVYPFTPHNVNIPGAGLNYTPWGLLSLLILAALVALATIFLYKNRKLQIRMCVFNTLIMAGYYIVFLLFMFLSKASSLASFQFAFGLCIPFIAIILNYLAIRAIRKDEDMVKAADRLR